MYDEGEEVTGYCFNQNYDPPALDKEDCTYKRLVGSPELLYELAQSKLPGVSAQELYDHVLSMIYHRDDIKAKYGCFFVINAMPIGYMRDKLNMTFDL